MKVEQVQIMVPVDGVSIELSIDDVEVINNYLAECSEDMVDEPKVVAELRNQLGFYLDQHEELIPVGKQKNPKMGVRTS